MTMTLTETRKCCTAWSKKTQTASSEIYECSCKVPSDMETVHITDTSQQRTLCGSHVHKILPFMREIADDVPEVADDVPVCRRCRELERMNLKREKLRQKKLSE